MIGDAFSVPATLQNSRFDRPRGPFRTRCKARKIAVRTCPARRRVPCSMGRRRGATWEGAAMMPYRIPSHGLRPRGDPVADGENEVAVGQVLEVQAAGCEQSARLGLELAVIGLNRRRAG